jgi:DNA polymerase-1
MEHLRTGAKGVNFGVPYQVGAEAVARKCKEEGTEVAVSECQALIDGYFELYPLTFPYLEDCKQSVTEPGWMCNSFLRFRRFAVTDDKSKIAEQERQACNFPIQSLVADAISLSLFNLVHYREKYGHRADVKKWFRMVLQIHDALMFELHPSALPWMIEEVLPACMSDGIDVWPHTLQGEPLAIEKPYHFQFDATIEENWGDKLTRDRAIAIGVPDKFCPKQKAA